MTSSLVLILGFSGALLLSACGQSDSAAGAPASDPKKIDLLTKALFDARGEAEFQAALKAARAGKVGKQALLEARFLFLIDQHDNAGIANLVPELVARQDQFKVEDSAIFGFKEEWQSVVHYARALAALENDDPAGFKSHITEAYWLSPRQASVFTPHIEELRLDTEMTKVRVDLQQVFPGLDSTTRTTLQHIAGDAQHVVLHFWSPWSRECVSSINDFVATSNELVKNQIPVIAILADSSPDILPDATAFRSDLTSNPSITWLLDDPQHPLGRLLRVTELPTVALVDKSGAVLFNGRPTNPKLWLHLQQVAPKLVRPSVQPAPPSADPTLPE